MEPLRKNKPVIHEREVIVPLDPAHEEKPTLVERERIEKERAEKEENQLNVNERGAVCSLPAEEEDQSGEDEEPGREETIK
jgi:hypothetical protein